MQNFCVYILYSPSADKYYAGQTDDLETRMEFHNQLSENSFTSRYRPWELKLVITVKSRSHAVILEKYIKGRKSRRFLQGLIEDEHKVFKLITKLGIPGAVG